MSCKICGNKTNLFFESSNGVIPNKYYDKKTNSNFNFSLNTCSFCCSVETKTSMMSDSQIFDSYTYRSPNTNMDLNSINFILENLQNHLENSNLNICEVGGNNGLFLSKLLPSIPNKKRVCHIDKIFPKYIDKVEHIDNFLDSDLVDFYELNKAFDLVIARHCMAHNEDIIAFWGSLFSMVTDDGLIYVELADLRKTIINQDFGQFYPEHRYSLSNRTIRVIAEIFSFNVISFKELEIHNGSIGVILKKVSNKNSVFCEDTETELELNKGIENIETNFDNWLQRIKHSFDNFESIGLWGASAKAVFTLNLLGENYLEKITTLIDNTPEKFSKYPPGFKIRCLNEYSLLKERNYIIGAPNYMEIFKDKARKFDVNILNTYDFSLN